MVIANNHSVVGDSTHASCQIVVVGEDSTAVSVAAEVLRGEETGTTDMTDGTCLLGLTVSEGVFRSDSLTCVLYDKEVMLFGESHDSLHVGALAEQVYRHDGFGTGCDGFAYGFDIHIHRLPLDINHHRRQA